MDPTDIALAIPRRLAQVRADIAQSAAQAGRRSQDIRLIAVTKTLPAPYVAAAVKAGQRDFGESTLQDALTKIPAFAHEPLTWHFIGHLQSNKAKLVPGHFHWMHSLDSAGLAQRLSQRAEEAGALLNTLIEVNITGDPRKHGVAAGALLPLLDELLATSLPGIALRGLMAIGPYPATEMEVRRAFAAVRNLRDDAAQRYSLPGFTELSMGMSGDYAAAIQEGSTMVRIGTAIFGERDYTK
jgi:pyridoxal phosphate enzyme (YggS family)